MNRLEALLREGVAQRVFEHANACVWHQGAPGFSGGTADAAARFDLASVTKVMLTTASCL